MKHYKVSSKSELKHIMFDIKASNMYNNSDPSVSPNTVDVTLTDQWNGKCWEKCYEVLTWLGKPYVSEHAITYHTTKEDAFEKVAEVLNLN